MAQSSRFALRALESLQRQARPSCRVIQRHQLPSARNFSARAACRADAATQTQPVKPSTASAAATESALSTGSPLPTLNETDPNKVDWSKSFHGLSQEAFPKEAADVLLAPVTPDHIEIKPDGIIYLPEIHYRRILNRAFGPGAWGLAPRGETIVTDKAVTREYALVAHGRLVSIARGEQDYFSKDGIPTASEGCKSNAMMRCCKDLGIASELWDPRYIKNWKAKNAREVFVEHQTTKKRSKIWTRKDDQVKYPFKEMSSQAPASRSVPLTSGSASKQTKDSTTE